MVVCPLTGSVSILPTVLYLLLGVIRELVHQPSTHTGNTHINLNCLCSHLSCFSLKEAKIRVLMITMCVIIIMCYNKVV